MLYGTGLQTSLWMRVCHPVQPHTLQGHHSAETIATTGLTEKHQRTSRVQETLPGALTPEELEERIKDVHVLGIRSKMQLRAGALQHAKKLLAVGCFCIGTNQVDLEVSCYLSSPDVMTGSSAG